MFKNMLKEDKKTARKEDRDEITLLEKELAVDLEEKPKRRKKRKKQQGRAASEYLWAVFVNSVLLYFFNNLSSWRVDFLTGRFSDCLPVINLSLGVTILGNFLLLFIGNSGFYSLIRAVMNCLLTVSLFSVYKIFPFSFPGSLPFDVSFGVRLVLLIIMIGTGVATLLEFLNWLLAPSKR